MKKGFLRKSFSIAALSMTVLSGTAQAQVPSSSVGRALTAGERDNSRLFGDAVKADAIRWHAGPSRFPIAGEAFDENTVAAYGHPFLSLDYSKEQNAFNYGMYFHETMHNWQYATGWRMTKGHCPGGYFYDLKPGMKLTEFCSEAQAAIVEDYARRFIKPQSATSNWYVQMCGHDTPENDTLLLKVVEEQFPNARQLRQKIGRGETLPDARPLGPGESCNRNPPRRGDQPYPDGSHRGNPPPDAANDPQKRDPSGGPNGGIGGDTFRAPKLGKPTFFCETLNYIFTRIKDIADKEGVPAWSGMTATVDDRAASCVVTAGAERIATLGAADFRDGLMRGETLETLVAKISEKSPDNIRTAVHNNLSTLFTQMSDRQKAEKQALRNLKTRDEAVRTLQALQTQLREDPSLPDNSRQFMEEKVKIVQGMIAKFDGVVEPEVKKNPPPVQAGKGAGGGKKPVAGPAKKPDSEFIDPDRNIKKLLDAYGQNRQIADARRR